MFPTDFTMQDAVKQAKVLGVALNTMERWIPKSAQTAYIERLAIGLYRKYPHVLHSEGSEGVREIVPSLPSLPHSLILYLQKIDTIDIRYNRIVIGYRCAADEIVMSSYEPIKNPL